MSALPDHTDIEAVLLAADAAQADGRLFEAIDDLSARNRAQPDPRIERRLVELRHAAFGEISRTAGRPSWPLDLPDPFPGRDGLITVRPDVLSGDLLGGAIVNHGCLRVDGLLSPDEVARFRDYIDLGFDARERVLDGAPLESGVPWFVPFEPGQERARGFGRDEFLRTVDAPRALCDLIDVFTATGVLGAMTDYFNERPAMIANKWSLRRSPSGKIGTDFHQDGAFLGPGIRTVDCWISLSRCGPGTGRPGIDLVPRRFESILETGEGSAFPWSLTESTVHAASAGTEVIGPVFEPGDAMFFDERLPHRTTVGTDLSVRYAIESWFVAPSSYQSHHVPVVI